MSLHQTIKDSLKDALKAKEEVRLRTIRSMMTAFTNEAVATGGTPQTILTDEQTLAVIKRLAKQRKDSADQFEKGGRPEMAEKEKAELVILEAYLPQQASHEEIVKVATELKAQLGVADASGAGKLMGAVIKALGGNADGAVVKEVVQGLF